MGMYDHVNFKMKCPECGKEMADWQSKDDNCLGEDIEIDAIDRFYTSCINCNIWYQFDRKRDKPKKRKLTQEEIQVELNKFDLSASPIQAILEKVETRRG